MADIKFKDFTADNLFDFCAVLDAVGAEEVINAFDEKEIKTLQRANKNIEKIGIVILMKIVKIIIKNIPKAKNEICLFLSGCTSFDNGTETMPDDFHNMKIVSFIRLLKELSKREDLIDFFGEAAELFGLERKDSKNSSTDDTQTQTNT